MLTSSTILIIFLLQNNIIIVKSDLIYPLNLSTSTKDTFVKIPLWSASLWSDHFIYTDIALVNLGYDRDIFDYCDFRQVVYIFRFFFF